jgi:hypothetical protein
MSLNRVLVHVCRFEACSKNSCDLNATRSLDVDCTTFHELMMMHSCADEMQIRVFSADFLMGEKQVGTVSFSMEELVSGLVRE